MTDQFELVCAATNLAGDRKVLIIPAGRVESTNGVYLMDAQAADLTIKAFTDHGTDRPVDFEHSTLTKGETGERADACGWIKQLKFRDDKGLVASIQWTDEGREAIASGKYRYISPVIAVRRSDRRVVALHSAGLTNVPAIPRLEALAASQPVAKFLETLALGDPATPEPTKDPGMPVGGDGEGTSPAAAAAGDPKIVALIRNLLVQIRDALSLDEKATAQDVLAVLAEFIELTTEAESDTATMRANLRAELEAEHEVEQAIAHYVKVNKLRQHDDVQMAWARSVASHDVAAFRQMMDAAPHVAPPPGRITPRAGDDATSTQMAAVAGNARSEYRANRAELSKWTDEESFVAMRLREHNLQTSR